MSLTIKSLYETNFSAFNNLSSTRKSNQIKKIQYIESVAQSFDLNISELDLTKFLPTNEDGSISASPREINRIIANIDINAIREEVEQETTGLELTPRQLGQLKSAATRTRNRARQQRENEFNQIRRQIDSAYRQVQEYAARALTIRRELDNTRDTYGDAYIEAVQRLIATGHWNVESIGTSNIVFVTRNDVINTHRNPRANINLRVNLGKFKVTVDYQNLSVRVSEHSGNFEAGGHIHPHVGSSGSLCLGNISEMFSNAQQNGDLFTLVDLTYRLLTTYNDGNPYTYLGDFAEVSGQIQPDGRVIGESDYNDCEDCGHSFDFNLTTVCPDCGYEH